MPNRSLVHCAVRPVELVALALLSILVLQGGSCLKIERPYSAPNADALVSALQKRSLAVKRLRAETRMSHQSAEGKIKATVRLMAARGGQVRFDAVSPFDTPLSTLVSDGKRFALIDAKANRYYHGPAKPCNLARLLQVQLDPDAVLALLGGSTPLIGYRRASVSWDSDRGQEVLLLEGHGRKQRIVLDGQSGTPPHWDLLSSEITDSIGRTLLRIEASKHRREGNRRVPTQLSVRQPLAKAELDVTLRQLEINVDLPAAAFSLPPAGGLPQEHVDCGAPATSQPTSQPAEAR